MGGTPWGWLRVSRGSIVLCVSFWWLVVFNTPHKFEIWNFTWTKSVCLTEKWHVKTYWAPWPTNSVGTAGKVSLLSHNSPLAAKNLNWIYRASQGLFSTSFPRNSRRQLGCSKHGKNWKKLHWPLAAGSSILVQQMAPTRVKMSRPPSGRTFNNGDSGPLAAKLVTISSTRTSQPIRKSQPTFRDGRFHIKFKKEILTLPHRLLHAGM